MSGGKGGGAITVGYKMYLSAMAKWCQGPVDKVLRLYFDDKIAWKGEVTESAVIQARAKLLFGGDGSLGGVAGNVQFQFGETDQVLTPLDAALLKLTPETAPANRGVLSSWFEPWVDAEKISGWSGYFYTKKNFYWGNSIRLPQPGVRAQRVYVKDSGDEQWYPEKAGIMISGVEYLGIGWDYQIQTFSEPNTNWSNFIIPKSGWLHGDDELPWSTDGKVGGKYWTPFRSNIWLRRDINVYQDDVQIELAAENGGVLFFDGKRVAITNPTNIPIPNNKNNPVRYTIKNARGNHTIHIKAYAEKQSSDDAGNDVDFRLIGAELLAMNPVHIIRECLTSKVWGLGIPEQMLDDAQWRDAADRCYTERLGLCAKYDGEDSVADFMSDVLLHMDALPPQQDRKTGLIYLPLVRADYDINALFELDETNVIKVSDYSIPAFSELKNGVTVNYTSIDDDGDASVSVSDSALATMQGKRNVQTVSLPMIVDIDSAMAAAVRTLRGASRRVRSCSVYATRHAAGVAVGDVVKVTWPDLNMTAVTMRVIGAQYGLDADQQIKLTLVEDFYDFDIDKSTYNRDDQNASASVDDPEPIIVQTLFEAPYVFHVKSLGDQQANQNIITSPELGNAVVAFKAEQDSAQNAAVTIDDDDEGIAASTTPVELILALDLTTNVFTVRGESVVGQLYLFDDELMAVDAIDPTSDEDVYLLTVKRGAFDTVPGMHDADTIGFALTNAVWVSPKQYADSEVITVKLLPQNSAGTLDPDEATPMTMTFNSRASRPYPPANVKCSGVNWPSSLTNTVTMTWAHRNRFTQADAPVGYYDANVTKTGDTRYGVRFTTLDSNADVLYTAQDIDDDALTFGFNYTGDLLIELWTIDNLGRSLETVAIATSYSGSSDSGVHYTVYDPSDNVTIIDGGDIDD